MGKFASLIHPIVHSMPVPGLKPLIRMCTPMTRNYEGHELETSAYDAVFKSLGKDSNCDPRHRE